MEHQCCTRHDENIYASLATDISKFTRSMDEKFDVKILKVGSKIKLVID